MEALKAKGKLPVAEAAEAVPAAGYKNISKDTGNLFSMTFSRDNQLKRVCRGVYALKG